MFSNLILPGPWWKRQGLLALRHENRKARLPWDLGHHTKIFLPGVQGVGKRENTRRGEIIFMVELGCVGASFQACESIVQWGCRWVPGTVLEKIVQRGFMEGVSLRVPSEKHPFTRLPGVREMESAVYTACRHLWVPPRPALLQAGAHHCPFLGSPRSQTELARSPLAR